MPSSSAHNRCTGIEMRHTICVVYSPDREKCGNGIARWNWVPQWETCCSTAVSLAEVTQQDIAALECGVWGRKVRLAYMLRADDRVEVYRPFAGRPQGCATGALCAPRRKMCGFVYDAVRAPKQVTDGYLQSLAIMP